MSKSKDKKREETANAMKTQSNKTAEILADAEKNGYLPQIELNNYDKWLMKERQITLEERIAAKAEKRNQDYLKSRKVYGEVYADPNEPTTVGNWSSMNCDNYALRVAAADKTLPETEQLTNKKKLAEQSEKIAYFSTSQIREPTDWQLKQSDIIHTENGSDTNYYPMAFSDSKQVIYINDEILKENKNIKYTPVAEAAKGNEAAKNCLIYHELNHKHNWEHDGLGQLSYTPVNAAKGDVLTEKLSLCTEYLHMAKEYNDRKANGEKTIKYDDGTEKPLESLLDIYPGLKDAVKKQGSDVTNPETKKEIVQAAMNYWKEDRGKAYEKQTDRMLQIGNNAFNQSSFSKQMDLLKNEEETYQKVSTAMLSDINVGNLQIDLKDCKDIIDTYTTEDAKKMIEKHNQNEPNPKLKISVPSYQEYQEINRHLESIGKTSDEEKMQHIAQTVQTAAHSLNSYDKDLENIILSHNPQITMLGAKIERDKDTVIAVTDFGSKYNITEYAQQPQKNKDIAQLTTQRQQER